jgi:hypothetical protein
VTPTPSTPDLQNLIDQARTDLAQRLSIPGAQIKLVEATPVTWPDSSLGCPELGMFYSQVLIDGYLIRLHVDGKDYEYHANRGTRVFLCENPSPPVPGLLDDR